MFAILDPLVVLLCRYIGQGAILKMCSFWMRLASDSVDAAPIADVAGPIPAIDAETLLVRAQTVQDVVRSRYYKQEIAKGRTMNIVEVWPEVHAEMARVMADPDDLANCQLIADSSKDIAARNRADIKKQKLMSTPKPVPTPNPVQESNADGLAESTAIVAHASGQTGDCFMKRPESLVAFVDSGDVASDVLALPSGGCPTLETLAIAQACLPCRTDDGGPPIDPSFVDAFLEKKSVFAETGMRFRAASDAFRKSSGVVAPGKDFPDKVKYELHCGALCKTKSTRRLLSFQTRLRKALAAFSVKASHSTRCSDVAASGVVLALEAFASSPPVRVRTVFASIGLASGAYHRYPASQMYGLYSVKGLPPSATSLVPPYGALVLEHRRHPYVKPLTEPSHPLHEADRGKLWQYSDDYLTADLLESAAFNSEVTVVKFRPIEFTLVKGPSASPSSSE